MWQVPADKLTVEALSGVQSLLELAESGVHKTFVMDIYRHLIFNFYIWSRADYTVQSGIKLVSNPPPGTITFKRCSLVSYL